jgi:hypothetical protein
MDGKSGMSQKPAMAYTMVITPSMISYQSCTWQKGGRTHEHPSPTCQSRMTVQVIVDSGLKGTGELCHQIWLAVYDNWTCHIPNRLTRMVESDPESDFPWCILRCD